ncbi:MAG: hypothetical protein HOE48_07480 [Candidatus Latescibacteria bacterium]|nr:hypothetical protein [Candidatus Latescibacterota bacterium]
MELGEGLTESFDTPRDEDPFDAYCHHLIVDERAEPGCGDLSYAVI